MPDRGERIAQWHSRHSTGVFGLSRRICNEVAVLEPSMYTVRDAARAVETSRSTGGPGCSDMRRDSDRSAVVPTKGGIQSRLTSRRLGMDGFGVGSHGLVGDAAATIGVRT